MCKRIILPATSLVTLLISHPFLPRRFLFPESDANCILLVVLVQTDLHDLLKPISDHIQEIQSFRERNRGSSFFNHLSAISESIPALGWVAVVRKKCKYTTVKILHAKKTPTNMHRKNTHCMDRILLLFRRKISNVNFEAMQKKKNLQGYRHTWTKAYNKTSQNQEQ